MQQPRGDTRGSPTRESKPSEQRGEHDSLTSKRDAHHNAARATSDGKQRQQLLQSLQPAFSARTEKEAQKDKLQQRERGQ